MWPFEEILERIRRRRKEQEKKNTQYVICVAADKDRRPVRLKTNSFDHFKSSLKKFRNEDIFYIAKRTGRKMKQIKAFAVYNAKLNEVVCTKEMAFTRLLGNELR